MALQALRRAGYDPIFNRVETELDYQDNLEPAPEIILADFSMPEFDSLRALEILRERRLDIPFIIVSGTIGEERAVHVMKHGATDYVMKDRLGRLGQSVEQSLTRWRLKDEKIKAEQAVARLAAIVETSGDAIIAVSLDGMIASWNRAAELLYGYSAKEALGNQVSILYPISRRQADLAEDHRELWKRLLDGEQIPAYETVRVRKDLRRIEVLLSISPILNSDDVVSGASMIAIDITQRKRSERYLLAEQTVTAILTEAKSLSDAGPKVLQTVAECLRWEVAILWTVDSLVDVLQRTHTWHAEWANESFIDALCQKTTLERGVGVAGRAWSTGKAVWEPGIAVLDNDPTVGTTVSSEGLRGGFGLPMQKDAAMIGVIEFYHSELREPDKLLIATLDNIGSQLSQFYDRRRSEVALRSSERQFKQLADAMPQLVWTARQDGTVDYCNERYREYIGCERNLAPDKSWRDMLHPEDRDAVRERWDHSLHTSTPFESESRLLHHSTGSYRWFLVRAIPSRDQSGKVSHWYGTCTDIDEQRKNLDELRISEARFRNLIMALPAAVYTTDATGLITLFNEHAVELWGRRPDQGKDRWCGSWKLLRIDGAPLPLDEYPMAITIRGGRSQYGQELIIERPDGSMAYVRKYPELLRGARGEIVGAVNMVVDLTKVKQLENQFQQVQKMEAVGQLAGGIAHDFNNLLTIINGYSDMLLENLPSGDPSRDSLVEILKAGERSSGLTRQLLAFSRQQVLAPIVLVLNDVLTETEKMLRRLIGEDVEFHTILCPSLWSVRADPGQIEQVLMNLVVNARDAMPRGGKLTIETQNIDLDETFFRSQPEACSGPHVLLSVTDTGTGMTAEVKAKLFEPFFTTKGTGKGTGLGLATVYGIIKQSGGHLEVISEIGTGTTFRVYLPQVEHSARLATPRSGCQPKPLGTETIFVAEDEAGVRGLTCRILSECGYKVLEARDGKEAVEIATGHPGRIHLLITDVVMPGMGGWSVAEQLTERHPAMQVLFVSGYTDDAVIRHGVLRERVNFLQKPFSPNALALKVREILDSPLATRPL